MLQQEGHLTNNNSNNNSFTVCTVMGFMCGAVSCTMESLVAVG